MCVHTRVCAHVCVCVHSPAVLTSMTQCTPVELGRPYACTYVTTCVLIGLSSLFCRCIRKRREISVCSICFRMWQRGNGGSECGVRVGWEGRQARGEGKGKGKGSGGKEEKGREERGEKGVGRANGRKER